MFKCIRQLKWNVSLLKWNDHYVHFLYPNMLWRKLQRDVAPTSSGDLHDLRLAPGEASLTGPCSNSHRRMSLLRELYLVKQSFWSILQCVCVSVFGVRNMFKGVCHYCKSSIWCNKFSEWFCILQREIEREREWSVNTFHLLINTFHNSTCL
jgi:hypothetical protein